MLISAYQLAHSIPVGTPSIVTLAENYSGYISLSWPEFGYLYDLLDNPQSNGDGYMVFMDKGVEYRAMKEAATFKYEANRKGQPKTVAAWDDMLVLLREMRRDRVAMGLDYCYWDVG